MSVVEYICRNIRRNIEFRKKKKNGFARMKNVKNND